jgi:hypothetical protein
VYAAAIIAHGADHLRRGLDAVTPEVFWAGIAGAFLAGIAIAAALVAGRSAGALAVVVGLPSALGIAAVHLLPGWGPFSDSFWKPGTAAASWAAVSFEIIAALAFATAGVTCMRASSEERRGETVSSELTQASVTLPPR